MSNLKFFEAVCSIQLKKSEKLKRNQPPPLPLYIFFIHLYYLPTLSRYAKHKLEKREQEKAKRREKSAEKKVNIKEALDKLSEEELQKWKEDRDVKVKDRQNSRNERKHRLEEALKTGQRIVIDLEFPDKMNDSEIRSMCQQVAYCYGANRRASVPSNLILSGVVGQMEEFLHRQANGYKNWILTFTEKSYLEHFAEKKEELVYLTADSPHELQELDPGKIYIVGGIVDRNRHKGLCYRKAEEQGIATARLPIGDHIQLASSSVMCTNHVVEIMLKWMEVKDWEAAFSSVIPTRKRKETDQSTVGDGENGENDDDDGDDDAAVVDDDEDAVLIA